MRILLLNKMYIFLLTIFFILIFELIELKFLKLQRLQTQLKYMQTNFDEIEQSEQRLNKEKREIQREVRYSFFRVHTHLL